MTAALRCINLKINELPYIAQEQMHIVRAEGCTYFEFYVMPRMEADTTAVLFSPHLDPLLPQHSMRLLVNELVIRERKDWFIPNRSVLTRRRIKE